MAQSVKTSPHSKTPESNFPEVSWLEISELGRERRVYLGFESGQEDRGGVMAVFIHMGEKKLGIGAIDL